MLTLVCSSNSEFQSGFKKLDNLASEFVIHKSFPFPLTVTVCSGRGGGYLAEPLRWLQSSAPMTRLQPQVCLDISIQPCQSGPQTLKQESVHERH